MKNKTLLYVSLAGIAILVYFKFGKKQLQAKIPKIKPEIKPFKTGGFKSSIKDVSYPVKSVLIKDMSVKIAPVLADPSVLIKPTRYIRDFSYELEPVLIRDYRYANSGGLIGDVVEMDAVR